MNLPNKITLARICLIPLVVFFYMADFVPYGKLISAVLFIVAALTDNIDGRIARKRNLVTDLGKFLDPIADKVLVMAGFVMLLGWPLEGIDARLSVIFPYWAGVVCVILIFAREFIISGFRQIAATKKIVLAAEKSGKIKAALQDVLIALYMIWAFVQCEFYASISPLTTLNLIVNLVLLTFLFATTLLTIISGTMYIVKYRAVFKEKTLTKVEVAQLTNKKDEIFVDVLGAVIDNGIASTTFIQRKFSVGYSRARRILDQLEKEGFVSAPDLENPSNARTVLITKEEYNSMFGAKK